MKLITFVVHGCTIIYKPGTICTENKKKENILRARMRSRCTLYTSAMILKTEVEEAIMLERGINGTIQCVHKGCSVYDP